MYLTVTLETECASGCLMPGARYVPARAFLNHFPMNNVYEMEILTIAPTIPNPGMHPFRWCESYCR